MKKLGFTLAELVITLSIIGVAAVLVAPALSNLVPDKNKVKVLRYNAMLNNAISDILNDEDLYHPETKADAATGEYTLSCQGLDCVANLTTEIQNRVGISGGKTPDGSVWRFAIYDNSLEDNKLKIFVETEPNAAKCIYSSSCPAKNANIFVFNISKYGAIKAGDPLTAAYLMNPLNVNNKKEDLKKAQSLLQGH